MIIANRTLNIIDSAFTIIDRVERYDYVAVGDRIINIAATTAAIIIGVATYIITALQLFWLQHGERIVSATVIFTVNTVDYMHEVYLFGAETKRFITKTFDFIADRLYYSAIA